MKTIFTFLLLLGVAFGQVSPTGTNYSGLSTPGAITGTTVVGGLGVVSSVSPTYDLVADGGCDPTGTTAADTCFAAAHNYFNSKAGGTITGCGVFKLTAPPWVITNPGLKIRNSCGARGTPDFASANGGFVIESAAAVSVANPDTAPTLALVSGSITTAAVYVKYTYVNGVGETTVSPAAGPVAPSSQNVQLTAVPYITGGGFLYNRSEERRVG